MNRIDTLKRIIASYKGGGEVQNLKKELCYYNGFELNKAIDDAVFGRYIGDDGLQYFNAHYKHFFKVDDYKKWHVITLLIEARSKLLSAEEEMKKCNSFLSLYNLVEKTVNVKGLKELFWYDCSLRIGNSKMFEPKKYLMPVDVFIQHGAKEGARSLFNEDFIGERYVNIKKFKVKELDDCFNDMNPYLIESFLCVKKAELKKLQTP
jgi:hypothetical protein